MNNRKMKPIAAAIGTAFAVSLTASAVGDEANPFEAQLIEDGTLLAASQGDDSSASEDADAAPAPKDGEEASCGDGNCGSMSSDSDPAEGDGKTDDAANEDQADEDTGSAPAN